MLTCDLYFVCLSAALAFSKPRLQTFWRYAKVELRPPTPGEVGTAIGDAQKGFQNLKSGKWMNYTVRVSAIDFLL